MAAGSKDSHAPFTFDVVLPLIFVRMPVQFAQSTRFDGNDGGGNVGCREDRAVDELHASARGGLGGLHFACKEGEGVRHPARFRRDLGPLFFKWTWQIAGKNEEFAIGN